MEFFKEKQSYIVCFILFGLWTFCPFGRKFRYTIVFQVYTIFVTALVLCAFIYGIITDQIFKHATLSATVTTLLSVIIFAAFFITVLESTYTSMSQEDLIRQFSTVDRLFSSKMRIPYEQENRKFFMRDLAIVVIIFILDIGVVIYSHYENSLLYSIMYAGWILRIRLSLINKELMDIRIEQINHKDQNQIFCPASQANNGLKIDTPNSINKRLSNLKLIYERLYDICELINNTFGWCLLAIFTQSFCGLVSNGYWMFVILDDTLPQYGVLFVCLNFAIQNIAPMSMLAFHCSTCYQIVINSFE